MQTRKTSWLIASIVGLIVLAFAAFARAIQLHARRENSEVIRLFSEQESHTLQIGLWIFGLISLGIAAMLFIQVCQVLRPSLELDKKPVKRRALTALLLFTFIIGIRAYFNQDISYYMLTHQFYPIHKIETLHSPIAVKNWTPDGLLLMDGRELPIPGIRKLPTNSKVLTEITKRGVETATNGHIYGLSRVIHWCGNDPVREHIARVDVSDALAYLHVGEPTSLLHDADFTSQKSENQFAEWGWDPGDFRQFQLWQSLKDEIP